jgi:hypothetical protein
MNGEERDGVETYKSRYRKELDAIKSKLESDPEFARDFFSGGAKAQKALEQLIEINGIVIMDDTKNMVFEAQIRSMKEVDSKFQAIVDTFPKL